MQAMLSIHDVHSYYGAIAALKGVSAHISQGEIVTLIGANGAGKSTLLNTICASPKAKHGHILFKDEDITQLQTHQIARKGISLVPEGRRTFAKLTVEENLQMGAYFLNDNETETSIKEIYELFPRLLERKHQRAGTLSGGEQQMLAIGRALMTKPVLLLLDEPSLGLAPLIIKQIFEIIEKIRSQGVTIFLIEQNAHQALAIADRGYILENGEIVGHDTGHNLLHSDEIKKAYLGL